MSRPHHRSEAAEHLAVVALSARKGLRFSLIRESGKLLGQVEHVGLKPDGRPVTRPHAQRLVLSEPVAMKIVEALAKLGVALREARS